MPQYPSNQPVGLNYANIAATGTKVVKSSPGFLKGFVINSAVAGAVVTFYDNTAGSGTVISAFTLTNAITVPQPFVEMDILFQNGFAVVVATDNADITFTYR
jgi:hypothetical protein